MRNIGKLVFARRSLIATAMQTKSNVAKKIGLLGISCGIAIFSVTAIQRIKMRDAHGKSTTEYIGKPSVGNVCFELERHDKTKISEASFLGRFSIIYFGFTNCPDICPAEMAKQTEAIEIASKKLSRSTNFQKELNELRTCMKKKQISIPYSKEKDFDWEKISVSKLIQPIFISVDPDRDSGNILKAYEETYKNLIAVTGLPDDIRKLARGYRVYYSSARDSTDEKDYNIDHSILHFLVGPDGEFIEFYGRNLTASEMAEKLEQAIIKKTSELLKVYN